MALDPATLGQSNRKIAGIVFGEAVLARARWRTSPARDAAIRLVQRGRHLRDGAYGRLPDPGPKARD